MTLVSGGTAPASPVARIQDLVHRAAAEYGEGPFVADMSAGHWSGWSFRAASEAVRAFAVRLAARGVRAGDCVALQSENRPEWGLAYLAILEAGAIGVPLDAQLEDGDTGEILASSQARVVVASRAQYDKVSRASAARGLALEVVSIEEIPRPSAAAPPDPEPLAALLFTSGTTGSAKAVMLTHANILANVEACAAAFHFGDGDRFLSVLPQHHAFECTAGFLAPLRSGASIAYARSLKSNELREDLETSRATIMLGVPLLYEKLLAAITRLRMFVSGAAPLRPEVFDGFSDLGLLLLEGYGLTECAPVVIRGPNVMRGYFRNPTATASVLREGWFHSGDLGRVTRDGRLVLTGRIRNLIVTAAGKKVYPEEVEANLAKSPFVREVAVVAGHGADAAHSAREEVHAHIVPEREAIEPAARDLGRIPDEAFVRETLEREVERLGKDLAPFKRVRKLIIRTEELPKTTTGKVRRDTLR